MKFTLHNGIVKLGVGVLLEDLQVVGNEVYTYVHMASGGNEALVVLMCVKPKGGFLHKEKNFKKK